VTPWTRRPNRPCAPATLSAGCAISWRRGESKRRVEDVKKLIEEASALALVGAKDKGVSVRFAFTPRLNYVLADKVQVQQVLLNLIRNAIDAMETASVRELVIATAPQPTT
jgi:two-component system, LuxR family, sensor kinase FixL